MRAVSLCIAGLLCLVMVDGLVVDITQQGTYRLLIDEIVWLESASTRIHMNGRWYTQPGGEGTVMKLTAVYSEEGSGFLGSYNRTWFEWLAGSTPFLTSITTFEEYPVSINATVFSQCFPQGAFGTSTGDPTVPFSWFPSFSSKSGAGKLSSLNYLSFTGVSGSNIDYGKFQSGIGGNEFGPLILFNNSLTTVIVSPLTEFLIQVMSGQSDQLSLGPNGIVDTIPDNYCVETVVYAGRGITNTVMEWGDILLERHGKQRTSVNKDIFASYLGYATDIYYYYNPCDDTAIRNCTDYQSTILAIDKYRRSVNIPYKYYSLSSFWYDDKHYGGVYRWEDDYYVLRNTFPSGLSYLTEQLGVAIKAQIGCFALTSPYRNISDYDFVTDGNFSLPTTPDLWQYLFAKGQTWNLTGLNQDDIAEQLTSMSIIKSHPTIARAWLTSQGIAAWDHNISIQYSRALPSVTMSSTSVVAASCQLVSNDVKKSDRFAEWKIGDVSLFIYAVGLLPYKGSFFSSSDESPKSGPFAQCVEKAPLLQVVVSVLSAGPITPSDGVNGSDALLLSRTVSADGRILKPDRPAISIDSTWARRVAGGDGPDGQLWTTYTNIGGYTWGYVFAAEMKDDYVLEKKEIDDTSPAGTQLAGVSYELQDDFSLPQYFSVFDSEHPLTVKSMGTDYGSFRLYYTAPLMADGWIMLGEIDKVIPVSKQRVKSVEVAGFSALNVTFVGKPKEIVWFAFLHSTSNDFVEQIATSTVIILNCTLPDSGQATLTAPGGVCS